MYLTKILALRPPFYFPTLVVKNEKYIFFLPYNTILTPPHATFLTLLFCFHPIYGVGQPDFGKK